MLDHPTVGSPQLALVLPPAVPPASLWPAVEAAEEGGYGSIWVTDRTLSDVPWLDSLTLLGALAARTSRVTIGTSVLCVARRNPVLTAHALATTQYLSGGRLVAGVGLGGPATRRVRALRRAAGPAGARDRRVHLPPAAAVVGGDGRPRRRALHVLGVQLSPRPETPIPIWIGGYSPGAFSRAGRLGDGWLSVYVGPDGFRDGLAEVRRSASDAGRDPQALSATAYVFAAIGRHDGEAEAVLGPAVQNIFGAGLEQMSAACMYGTPDRWVDTISRFAEAGAQNVNTLLFSTDLARDVEIVVSEVLPQLAGRPRTVAGVPPARQPVDAEPVLIGTSSTQVLPGASSTG